MNKFLITSFVLLLLTGCSGNNYQLTDTVSPSLEGLQEPDDFFNSGWEINDAVTANAVDNLMGQF